MGNKQNAKKKIIFFNHGLASGGTDSFVVNVMKEIKNQNKFEILFIEAIDREAPPQFRENEVLSAGIPVFRTSDIASPKDMIVHLFRLYHLLKKEEPDVFHSNMDLSNGLNNLVAWLAGVPVRVSHSHTSNSQREVRTGRHLAVNVYRYFMRKLIWTFSNRRLGCSENAMNYLYQDKWKNDSHSKVVFNGIRLIDFSSTDAQILNVRNRLGIQDNIHIIGTVGRMSTEKNPLFMIGVFEKLLQKRKDIRFVYIGDGPLRSEVEKCIREKGIQDYFLLLGVQKNISELLPVFDVFLLPSIFEGQPVSLIEAQAANVRCVVSDTVTKSVDTGLIRYCSIEDITSWINAIEDIISKNDKKERDIFKLEKFDISNTVSQLIEVYGL